MPQKIRRAPRRGLCVGSASNRHVFERHRPRLLINPVLREPELCLLGGVRQQRQPTAEQGRDHGDLDRIHQPELEQAAEELAAAKEPDVLARGRLEGRPRMPGMPPPPWCRVTS